MTFGLAASPPQGSYFACGLELLCSYSFEKQYDDNFFNL